MHYDLFNRRLRHSVQAARRFAETMVTPALPPNTAFRVLLNQSFDLQRDPTVEKTFPEEKSSNRFLSPEEVVRLLWRDGWIPEWIDVAIAAVTPECAVAELRCCGRFTECDDLLYYQAQGTAPFGIKSPHLPVNWRGVERHGRFALPQE